MSRRLLTLLGAGLTLSACGTMSTSSALRQWVVQSNFHASMGILSNDVRHAAGALRNAHSTSNDLHTVCGVLLVDTESANASLPTPDAQGTVLLSRTYTLLGAGANECYVAANNENVRAKALGSLRRGFATLSEATVRIDGSLG